jgi:hypothetical protein
VLCCVQQAALAGEARADDGTVAEEDETSAALWVARAGVGVGVGVRISQGGYAACAMCSVSVVRLDQIVSSYACIQTACPAARPGCHRARNKSPLR